MTPPKTREIEGVVTHEEFVKVWMEAVNKGQNQTWIADRLSLSRQRVAQIAARMRSVGVELPKMSLRVNHLNEAKVDELNKLIKELNHERQ